MKFFFTGIVIFIFVLLNLPAPCQPMEGQWVAAGYLNDQMSVVDTGGKLIKIASLEVANRETTVYNMKVKDWPTYYANEILAHNADYDKSAAQRNSDLASLGNDDYVTKAKGTFVTGQCNFWDQLDPICRNTTIQESWGSPLQYNFEGDNASRTCSNLLKNMNDDAVRIWSNSWREIMTIKDSEAFTISGVDGKLDFSKGKPGASGSSQITIPPRQQQLDAVNTSKNRQEFNSAKMFLDKLRSKGCNQKINPTGRSPIQ